TLSPRPGTALARNVQALADTKSAVAGLIGEDSATNGRLTLTLPEGARGGLGPVLDEAGARWVKQAPNETERELRDRFFKALAPTLREGTLDVAGDLRGPSQDKLYTGVLAVRLKDGADLEKAIRASVDKLPAEARAKVTLDADKAGGVAVHRLNVEKDYDAKTRQNFGENPIYFAVRDDALFVVLGHKGADAVKGAVGARPKAGPVARVEMSLARMVPLMEGPKAAAESAREAFGKEKRGDTVYLTLEGGKALQLRAGMKGPVIRFFSLMDRAE